MHAISVQMLLEFLNVMYLGFNFMQASARFTIGSLQLSAKFAFWLQYIPRGRLCYIAVMHRRKWQKNAAIVRSGPVQ